MRIRECIIDWLMVVLLATIVCLPLLSWILSAFGVPCNSMLSGEGWRWLFLNFPGCAINRHTLSFASFLIMLGAFRQSGIFASQAHRHTTALVLSLFSGVLLLGMLAFAAFYPDSPLLSVTGRFYHSALVYGLPTALCFCGIVVASVFGFVSRNISTCHAFAEMLTYGISRYIRLIFIFIELTFIAQCLNYISI